MIWSMAVGPISPLPYFFIYFHNLLKDNHRSSFYNIIVTIIIKKEVF